MSQASRRLPALLAAAGLLCSVALEVVHVRAYVDPSASSFCSAGEKLDCATVALSAYSVFAGVPVPVWGIAAFVAILLAALTGSIVLLPLSAIAAVASLGLLVVELVSIHSVCLLCEGVHLVSFALLFVAFRMRRELRPFDRDELPKLIGVPALGLLAAFVFVPPYWGLYSWRQPVRLPHGEDEQGNHWIGAESPKVTVHEYVDYSCPHCAVASSRTRRMLASNASSLRVVRHLYPRMFCQKREKGTACRPARAAICAAEQGRFWEMDSWLFENAPGKPLLDVSQGVKALRLDESKFDACFEAPETYARADAAEHQVIKDRMLEVPGYIVDGKRYSAKDVFAVIKSGL